MTQNLTFALDSATGKYKAAATVNGDFNLHIKCAKSSFIDVFQKTAGTAAGLVCQMSKSIVDEDFVNAVYPKDITIYSSEQPSEAVLTSDETITVL